MPARLVIVNPNATVAMTEEMAMIAGLVAPPEIEIVSATNHAGPAAIQGRADAEACLPGLFDMVVAAGLGPSDALIIGCFDDTGLSALRAAAPCPVVGLGEAGMLAASLAGPRFAVLTTTAGSVPVIEANISGMGLAPRCADVVAADIPVLDLPDRVPDLREALQSVARAHPRSPIVLGCAGMSPLLSTLASPDLPRLIDPVRAAVFMALCVGQASDPGRAVRAAC